MSSTDPTREGIAAIRLLAVRKKPWWLMHAETCPRYGKATVDATLCTCDEATRAAINETFREAKTDA